MNGKPERAQGDRASKQARHRQWTAGPARPPLDRDEARRLYVEEGLTAVAIARRLGFSFATVHKALREQGLGPRPALTREGKWAPELYRRWKQMRSKCRRPGDEAFADYGGRGIGICAEWERFPAFHAWALQSGFRPGLDLALIDREQGFGPRNCRWQTRSETIRRSGVQGRRAVPIRAFGEEKPLAEWVRDPRCKVSSRLLRDRLLAGHSPEAAMSFESGAIAGTAKRASPAIEARPRRRKEVDWAAVERRMLARPVSFRSLARSLGVPVSMVHARLGHLRETLKQRSQVLPPEQQENLGKVWHHLIGKSDDPANPLHRYVGARGRGVCRAWRRREAFLAWAAQSGYRPGLWLSRLDQRQGFSPANCRWLAPSDAMRQPKFGVKPPPPRKPLVAFGESKSLASWARDPRCAPSVGTLRRRLIAGWDPEEALTTPPEPRGPSPRLRVRAFGESKGIAAWARDPRCKVGIAGLRTRLARGVPPEEAISTPGHQLPFEPRGAPDRPRPKRG